MRCWAEKPVSCDVGRKIPVSPVEKAAYKTSRYDDGDISILYEMCGEVDADDPYAEAGFAASSEQIPEINAALTLCPTHPYAKKWRQAVPARPGRRGPGGAGPALRAGHLPGRQGDQARHLRQPRDVDGCYWERQNSSGNIIDNYFTNSARPGAGHHPLLRLRLQLRGCGEWRPVADAYLLHRRGSSTATRRAGDPSTTSARQHLEPLPPLRPGGPDPADPRRPRAWRRPCRSPAALPR